MRQEWRSAVVIALVAGGLRLVVAALTPLFPDEMYYWVWSRRLAAGYFDHPPLIAWIIRFGTLIAGETPLGVRLGSVLAGITTTLFVAASARRLYGDRAALWSSVIFAVMPLSAAGLVLATPDAPLLGAVAAALYAFVRVLEHPPGSRESLGWWCAAGVATGIALCAKYTAVLFPFAVVLALLARRTLRPRLREPGPYVASTIAIILFLPVILWNARHDWASFAFQLAHGLGAVGGSAFKRELEMIGGQLGLVSPVLFVLCVIAVARGFRRDARSPQAALAVVATVIFGFFMYSATKRRVEANWPALSYLPATLLLVACAGLPRWHTWLKVGASLAAVLSMVAYVNAFTPILPVPARRDPAARASGWDDLARAVNRIHSVRLPLSSYRTHVAGNRYQEASALAFHLADHPETFSLNLSARANQYDLWPPFAERAHPRDGLIVVVDAVQGTHPTIAALARHFELVTKGEMVTLARRGDPVKYLQIWVLDRWRGTWPTGRVRSRS